MLCTELNTQKKEQLTVDNNGDYILNLSKYDESFRLLRLIGVMNGIAEKEQSDQGKMLQVKTVPNDKALSRMLRAELYPSIPCKVHVGTLLSCHA